MPRRDYDDDADDRYGGRSRDDDDRRGRRHEDDYNDDDDYEYGRRRRYEEPHRGTLILVLGLCGILVCGLCAPAAWIMGAADLAKMRAGTMDYSGYGNTQAGYVLGIIGSLLIIGAIVVVILVLGVFAAKA